MSGRDDESCDIMRHHAIRSGSGSGAGGVRCHSTEGVAEERRGGRSGSGRQAGVGSRSGRRVGVGSVRGSPYRAESGEDVLQKLVGGFMLTFHLVHGGLDGADTVLDHIGGQHGGGLVVRRGAGEGIFGRSGFRGGGVR